MRDVDDGHAVALQIFHDAEQCLHLVLRQRGGRLVKNQDLAVCGNGLCDLHRLHLRHAQLAQLLSWVEVHAYLFQQKARVLIHFFVIDHRDEAQQLFDRVAAKKDILSDGARGNGLKLLMHHGDAHLQRLHGVVDLHLFALIEDLALIHLVDAEHTLHERGFARAVLAHERMDGAGAELELRVIQRLDAGEGFAHAAHLQTVLRHIACLLF